MNPAQFWGGAAAPYEIEQSLRFNSADSAHLNRTPSTTGSRTTWTWSSWVKRGALAGDYHIFAAATSNHSSNPTNTYLGFTSADQFSHYSINNNSETWHRKTSQVFRDTGAWYHLVCVTDTSNATADNRIRVYVNGVEVTAWATNNTPSQNAEGFVNFNSSEHKIGEEAIRDRYSFDGYLAEINFIDGSALDPTDFGEFDDNGVWRPIKYAGSYTGNSFYLKFASGDGTDSSGLSNTWTANNFTTSGTGTDVMSDTPTNNFATINAIDKQSGTLTNGNLDITATGSNYSTIGVTSGKYYLEYTIGTSGGSGYNFHFGFETLGFNQPTGQKTASMGMATGGNSPNIFQILHNTNGTTTAPTGSRPSLPATIGCKLNLDDGEVEFLIGGSANGKITGITDFGSDPIGFFASHWTGTYSDFPCTVNFGQRAFANTIPTGYSPFNTSNLPAPDIADGSEYFNTVLWTGNATARDITTGHNSNFTWIKHRSSAENHNLYDILRGTGNRLESNQSSTETNYTDRLTTFNSDGFSLGTGYNNTTSTTYVGWSWAGGGSGSSIAAGSIDGTNPTIASTVSASPTSGFSIVSYTGTGAGESVAHGLGVAPSLLIFKNRDSAENWAVWHSALDATIGEHLGLNQTNAVTTNSVIFNSTAPTSTVFSVGNNGRTGLSGDDYIAYCFAEVEGYSKFGSYTGNGSSDGPFVFCGFKPAWLLIKRTNTTGAYKIFDNERPNPYNVIDARIEADSSGAESTNSVYSIDLVSNGFKLRGTSGEQNGSGDTFVFAAFASSPFGGSGVSPATAR